jgi:hypothetical protein
MLPRWLRGVWLSSNHLVLGWLTKPVPVVCRFAAEISTACDERRERPSAQHGGRGRGQPRRGPVNGTVHTLRRAPVGVVPKGAQLTIEFRNSPVSGVGRRMQTNIAQRFGPACKRKKQVLMHSFLAITRFQSKTNITSEIGLRKGLNEVSENPVVQRGRPDTIIRVGGDKDSWDRLARLD